MGIQISPFGNNQFFTIAGKPAVGYQLFTYTAKSDSKTVVYTDRNGIGKHTNPIILDNNGLTPAPIYIDTAKSYKFVFCLDIDNDPPTVPLYTVDQVTIGLETPTISTVEWSTGTTPSFISGTQFSVTGDQTPTYTVGRRVKAFVGAGTIYGLITAVVFSSVTTVTVSWDSGALDGGLSAIFYSFLSASGSSWPGGRSSGNTTIFSGAVTIPVTSSFNIVPVGSTFPFAGTASPPAGYLKCDGAAVSRSQFASLFSQIGTVFGSGDGSTTFNVPNISTLVAGVGYIIRYA